jgi:Kef-type K+ transport system membrane component KefB
MTDTGNLSTIILLLGLSIILVIISRIGLKKIRIPSLVGFILLGFILRTGNEVFGYLANGGMEIFDFLAKVGLITLLFQIGLETNVAGLVSQLKRASFIWVGNVAVNWTLGFVAAYYLLHLGAIPSVFIGTALTATSVGIPVGVWRENKAINSPRGQLLIDVAEMDDISGIIAMVVLFAIAPALRHGSSGLAMSELPRTIGIVLLKFIIFGTLCYLFSRFLEARVTGFFKRIKSSPNPILVVAGVGIVLASLAGMLGFSLAVGGFFSGLAFSRDPRSVKIESSFETISALFSPFFFIGIGLEVTPQSVVSGFDLGLILLLAAVLGKLIGDGLPTLLMAGWVSTVLIAISMVPRAEITMIIMKQGLEYGDWAVTQRIYTGLVFVSIISCILPPIFIRKYLKKWPQKQEERK